MPGVLVYKINPGISNYKYLMFLLRILLFPFAVLYDLITRARNHLYNVGLKPSATFDVPLICVGNLTIGGTGKTPMVEYLVRLLSAYGRVATLSRGYGRKTNGIRIAGDADSATTLGDEPFQFHNKFQDRVVVAVGEDRALAVSYILDRFPDTPVIILDDAFQHRRVKPALNILLTDYNKPFYDDFLLPAGHLRETKSNAARADIVVVTKCPADISGEETIEIERQIRKYTSKPVFYSQIRYGEPVSFGGPPAVVSQKVVLITGIADARPIKNYVNSRYQLIKHFNYKDHRAYSARDIQKISEWIGNDGDISIITTEKDMVKMNIPLFNPLTEKLPFFYIPIEVSFVKNGEDFDALVTNIVNGKPLSFRVPAGRADSEK